MIVSLSLSLSDDTNNETSVLSFFEATTLPVYSGVDKKTNVANGITHDDSVIGEDSIDVDEALSNCEEMMWRDDTAAEETVATGTEDASPVLNLVEVQIEDRTEEDREEREIQEETGGEEEEEVIREEEAVQFIRGMSCLMQEM